jgi:hypothetical protein
MEMVDLRAEAIAEVHRLARSRAMTVNGDQGALAQLEAEGPWIAVARRQRMRRALGRRLLLVWRVAIEDAMGTPVETRLVAVTINLTRPAPGRLGRRQIEAIVLETASQVRAAIDADSAGWRTAAEGVLASFTALRTARERAIAAAAGASSGHAFQPGLFDRRAERAREQATAAATDLDAAAARRRGAIARSAAVGPPAARLLIVLAP